MRIFPLLDSIVTGDEHGVSSMIPKQKYKAWNGAQQAPQDKKNFDFKKKKKEGK
jgi:hypothetical protein